jgi:hypothetical protein
MDNPLSETKPAAAAGPKPKHRHAPRARWTELHAALECLIEARALAVEDQIDGEVGGK